MGAPKTVDLTKPAKSQSAADKAAADKAAADQAAAAKAIAGKAAADKAAADQAAADKLAAEKAAAENAAAEKAAADRAAADKLAADLAALAAQSDTKIVRAIHTVGLAGGKMKAPGEEFELASDIADDLEELGVVAFLEDAELEERVAAIKARKKK